MGPGGGLSRLGVALPQGALRHKGVPAPVGQLEAKYSESQVDALKIADAGSLPSDLGPGPRGVRLAHMRVPPVDPTKPHRIRKALIEPIARTEAGRWWLINGAPKLDPLFYRLSGGRFTSVPLPMLFLTHTGARSGEKSTTPLVYFTDGEDAIVVASNYGRKNHPAWYYNVKANPEVELTVAGRVCRYRAEVTSAEDRERLWQRVVQMSMAYATM